MKYRVASLLLALFIVAAGIALFSSAQPTTIHISLSSDPFPLSVGQTTLLVSLTDGQGRPVEGASVDISGQMMHMGMLALNRRATRAQDGVYEVPVVWPMMGEWTVDVTARLPDREITAQEQYELYVYGMYTTNRGSTTTYKSQGEYVAALAAKPPAEFWIVIPQGAQALIRGGQHDEIIPAEIRLNVSGQNVLVIQNDDIVDHDIGPFYVRAGETIRQKFTLPAVYQGACSINYNAAVSIIVEA